MNLDYYFESVSENVVSSVDLEHCTTTIEEYDESQVGTTLDSSSKSDTLTTAKYVSPVDVDRFVLPDSFIFPTRLIGGHLRSFSLHWMRKFDWLEYT